MQILVFEAIVVLFLIFVTLAVIFDRDLFACTILFGVFSFTAVMTYLMFGSPDVAFTEAVIGTMSTVYFAVALKKVDRFAVSHRKRARGAWERMHLLEPGEIKKVRNSIQHNFSNVIAFICIAAICLVFCAGAKYLPTIGDSTSAPNSHVSDYYIENSKEDTAANNIVSGTLADYRGYDTMFETSVMFVSGLVVMLVLTSGKDTSNPLAEAFAKRKKRKEG